MAHKNAGHFEEIPAESIFLTMVELGWRVEAATDGEGWKAIHTDGRELISESAALDDAIYDFMLDSGAKVDALLVRIAHLSDDDWRSILKRIADRVRAS